MSSAVECPDARVLSRLMPSRPTPCSASFASGSSRTCPLGCGGSALICALPEAKSADERIGFVTFAATRRKLFQVVDVATAEHHVFGQEGRDQARDHVRDILAPFLLAVPLQSATADIVLVGCFPVGKMAKLHGLDDAVHDQGRTKTGSQTEEEHFSTLVGTQCLHGCIVDNLDRAAECGAIVEADPAPAQIVGLRYRPSMEDRPRIAHRHYVVLPTLSQRLGPADHLFGGERWPGRKLPVILLSGGEYLDVRPAHVDNEHLHERFAVRPKYSADCFIRSRAAQARETFCTTPPSTPL